MLPDWEAWERTAKAFGEYMQQIEESHCLDTTTLPAQTMLIVTCSNAVVEFTIRDGETGEVLVKDNVFTSPTEGKLLGTEVPGPTKKDDDVIRLGRRVLLPRQLKRIGLLNYDVEGATYKADGIHGIKIVLPSGTQYNLWTD